MTTTADSLTYARNHDGRLPFAPVCDLEGLRHDAAIDCAILMNLRPYMSEESRERNIAEAVTLARYFGDLLSAAIWRTAAEGAAR